MAFLNLFSIADKIVVPASVPWEWLILTVFSFIENYGWRILIFTVSLKLVLFPLDLYQRLAMRKNQKITERMKPQLEKLQKMYGGDKTVLSQKQMELNKKEGFSYFSSCLPMIVTLVVFITLFNSMNYISQYMSMKAYLQMSDVYDASMSVDKDVSKAQDAVVDFYYNGGGQVSFLWIKNVWSSDVPWVKPVKNYADFITAVGDFGKPEKHLIDVSEQVFKDKISDSHYASVTGKLATHPDNNTNGYLILVVLSVGFSFLSQFLTSRQQKASGMSNSTSQMAGTMKVMMIIFPIMIGWFALSYTSVFTLYLVTNSAMSIIMNLVSTGIMKLNDKRADKLQVTTIQQYGRPDPNSKNKK